MSRALLMFAFVSIYVAAECNLIHGVAREGFTTKEVLVPHEEQVEVISNAVDAPVDEVVTGDTDFATGTRGNTIGAGLNKKCVAVGEFCMNHSDCCTNACLGYLKRCVT